MKNALFALFVPFLLLQSCQEAANSVTAETTFSTFADSLFKAGVDQNFIAGAAAFVQQGEEVLLDKSYGYASLELEAPMPAEGIFEIGSVTKQFTGAAILKLEEMGKLSLEDNFTKYIDFDTKGRMITVAQLMDHTSGIASYTEIPSFWELSLHNYPKDTLVTIVENTDFLYEPGEALIYNNSAFFLLGLIIEELADTTYEAFLKEQLFDPLGMENTYYCSNSKVVKNKAYGYDYSPDALVQKSHLDHTWPYAAGSLCSTTGDLMKWLKAIHKDDFLGGLYQKLITPAILKDGTPINYAKGIVNSVDNGHPVIQHGGGINGFLSETRYYPEEDLFVVCLVNTTGPQGGGFFANELTWKVLEKKEYPREEIDFELAEITGTYSGQVRGRMIDLEVSSLADGILIGTPGDDNPDTLRHYAGEKIWRDGNETILIQDGEMRINENYNYYILKKK